MYTRKQITIVWMPNITLVCTYLIVFQVLDFYIAKTLKE